MNTSPQLGIILNGSIGAVAEVSDHMKRLKTILQGLKNPSVLLGILSQIIAVLLLLEVDVNISLVTGLVTAVCSILSLLGLMQFPLTGQGANAKSPADKQLLCADCKRKTPHILVNGLMTCSKCGCIYSGTVPSPDEK